VKKDFSSLPKGLYQWLEADEDEQKFGSSETDVASTRHHEKKYREKSSYKGLPDGWTRATFILKEEHVTKIRAVAYWERITLKELLEEALTRYLEGKEDVLDLPVKKVRSISKR